MWIPDVHGLRPIGILHIHEERDLHVGELFEVCERCIATAEAGGKDQEHGARGERQAWSGAAKPGAGGLRQTEGHGNRKTAGGEPIDGNSSEVVRPTEAAGAGRSGSVASSLVNRRPDDRGKPGLARGVRVDGK